MSDPATPTPASWTLYTPAPAPATWTLYTPDDSGLRLTLGRTADLVQILGLFGLGLDSTYEAAEAAYDRIRQEAHDAGAADMRAEVARLTALVQQLQEERDLARMALGFGQAGYFAKVRGELEVLAAGLLSGNAVAAGQHTERATQAEAKGIVAEVVIERALAQIHHLHVALQEQGRESERRHRVATEDIRRHQDAGAELAALVNEAHALLDRLGVPRPEAPGGRSVADRIRVLVDHRIQVLVATSQGAPPPPPPPRTPSGYACCRHCGSTAIRVDGPCGSCGRAPFVKGPV